MPIERPRIPVNVIKEVIARDVHCQYPLTERYNSQTMLWEVTRRCKQSSFRRLQLDHLMPVCVALELGWSWEEIHSPDNLSLICRPHHVLKDKFMSPYKAQLLRQAAGETIGFGEHVFLGMPPRKRGGEYRYT